jgi:hypothetical protein
MTFYVKLLWYLTVLGFVVVLMGVYRVLTPDITLDFGAQQGPGRVISRDMFFYGYSALFLLMNIFFTIMIRMVPFIPKRFLGASKGSFWASSRDHIMAFNSYYIRWFYGLLCVANFFIMVSMLLVENYNHIEGNRPVDRTFMFTLGTILLVLTLISLPVRLAIKKIDLTAREEQ